MSKMKTIDSAKLVRSSIEVISSNQTSSGAYIASPNFRVYNYSWFRDGAFIADAMLELMEYESAGRFHAWAAEVINSRIEKIQNLIQMKTQNLSVPDSEHLHCRYTADGQEGQESWTNFQLDGFGTWLWAVSRYISTTKHHDPKLIKAIEQTSQYLMAFWDSPSYDWWEESYGHLHVSSIGAIAAGLRQVAIAQLLRPELTLELLRTSEQIKNVILDRGLNKSGSLRKWLDEDGLDSSTVSLIAPLDLFDETSSLAAQTLSEVIDNLGKLGTHRHLKDVYYGGGPWPLLSAFVGLALLRMGRITEAREILNWFEAQADEQLHLPEQLDFDLLFPANRETWIEKWGQPAKPLLWSHAMYLKLLSKAEQFEGNKVA